MNRENKVGLICMLVFSLLLTGCGAGQVLGTASTPTPTLAPTSAFVLKCEMDVNGDVKISILGESGPLNVTFNNEKTNIDYGSSGIQSGKTVNVNRDLVYVDSQHSYHVEGVFKNTIDMSKGENVWTYNITATGNALGNSTLTCVKS